MNMLCVYERESKSINSSLFHYSIASPLLCMFNMLCARRREGMGERERERVFYLTLVNVAMHLLQIRNPGGPYQ